MIINELAQWAVLAFLAVFVLGLTRQLGNFLVPKREQATARIGPRVGDRIPNQLLTAADRVHLDELMRSRAVPWAFILIVDEDCSSCSEVIDDLMAQTEELRAPVAIVSRKSGAEHRARLESVADLVIVDGERLKASELLATPFSLIVDDEYRVQHKSLAAHVERTISEWVSGKSITRDEVGWLPSPTVELIRVEGSSNEPVERPSA